MMTVKELREALSNYPDDMAVVLLSSASSLLKPPQLELFWAVGCRPRYRFNGYLYEDPLLDAEDLDLGESVVKVLALW